MRGAWSAVLAIGLWAASMMMAAKAAAEPSCGDAVAGGTPTSPQQEMTLAQMREELKEAAEAHQSSQAAEVARRIGVLLFRNGEADAALGAFREALSWYKRAGDLRAQARMLEQIAVCYEQQRAMSSAVKALDASLVISRRLGDRRTEFFTLSEIANNYRVWGFPDTAVSKLKPLLAKCPDAKTCPARAQILNMLGLAYFGLHQSDLALKLFEQALVLERAEGNALQIAFVLNNIGAAYNQMKRGQEALVRLEEARELGEDLEDGTFTATNLCNRAYAHRLLRQSDIAREEYEAALATFRSTGNKRGEEEALKQIALLEEGPKKRP